MLAPSILNADNLRLGQMIRTSLVNGIERFHIDIMDGHFVPNLSYGPQLVKDFKTDYPDVFAEVHLMSDNLPVTLPLFVKAGCDLLEFHLKATSKPEHWLDYLHDHQVKAGVVLDLDTSVEQLEPLIEKVDQVLVMSVKPGFGGQSFHPEALDKVRAVKRLVKQANHKINLEIDGGINDQTIEQAAQAGVDIFVAGSFIFAHESIANQIAKLREAIK